MWLLIHFLRSIPTWTLTVPSAIVKSLPPSLWFPLRGEWGNWKYNTFSAVEDSTMLWWHSGTQKRGGRTKQRDQIDNEARLFWKSIVKTKHQSLTSLAFIWLVPGVDRAVHHICIWCIAMQKCQQTQWQQTESFIHVVQSIASLNKTKQNVQSSWIVSAGFRDNPR